MRQSPLAAFAASAAMASATPALAQSLALTPVGCPNGCSVKLTPEQLLHHAETLVAARNFDAARPLVVALTNSPEYSMQRHFLAGYIAVETGAFKEAIAEFRAALVQQPQATRIRLELARALMLSGKDAGADYNYRLAQRADDLPPEVAATIKAARNLLRDRRPWHVNIDAGIAPDTNINSGTSAETIDITVGQQTLPFTLGGSARKRSGIGQTLSMSAGYRFKLSDRALLVTDLDTLGVNYKGTDNDDYTVQAAIGPKYQFNDNSLASIQLIGSQRWYGGQRASTQLGLRTQFQHVLDRGERIGLTVDGRHTNSGFSPDYDGWSLGAYASYERVLMRTFIASSSVFVRTDRLNGKAFSNKEFGGNLGLGGELPHGINAGISGSVSRAAYDAPYLGYLRRDWRYSATVYAGLRSFKVAGLSPSVSWSLLTIESSSPINASSRQRVSFALAKYF